jgi:MFS family permease
VAILVYAFERGGAAATGLAAVIMLLPAALVAPFASVLGDRIRRERALLLGYAAQAVVVAATATAMLTEASVIVV